MAGRAPRYPIESVDNALRLLLLLAERGAVGVSEAGTELGVAPSTAHRLLAMLEHRDFIEQDGGKAYRVGPALIQLGISALRGFDIRAKARPHIERLVAEVGETAHLIAMRATTVMFLDGVECGAALRAALRIGKTLPAHCTAGGKVLLAGLEPARLRELYPSERLEAITENSTTSRRALLAQLATIRERGYAINERESEVDLNAVAAAIRDGGGAGRGAITVAGPPQRMTSAKMEAIAGPLVRAAGDIGRSLP